MVRTRKVNNKITHKLKRHSKRFIRDMLLSRYFHFIFKLIIGLGVSISAFYGVYALINQTVSSNVVISETEVIQMVNRHIKLPPEEPESVVRVEDPETLSKQNIFYQDVKEGDYILIYKSMAVIYDLRNDAVVSVKK